jgi:hypothetical protein
VALARPSRLTAAAEVRLNHLPAENWNFMCVRTILHTTSGDGAAGSGDEEDSEGEDEEEDKDAIAVGRGGWEEDALARGFLFKFSYF